MSDFTHETQLPLAPSGRPCSLKLPRCSFTGSHEVSLVSCLPKLTVALGVTLLLHSTLQAGKAIMPPGATHTCWKGLS
jgi:hypothetical protein